MTSLQESPNLQRICCSSCGAQNRTSARFCGSCSHPLAAAPSPANGPLVHPVESHAAAPTPPPPPPPPESPPIPLGKPEPEPASAPGVPPTPPPPEQTDELEGQPTGGEDGSTSKIVPPNRRSPAWKKYALIAVSVVAVAAVVFLLYPRPVFVVASFEVPEVVVSGDDLPVSVVLVNEGRAGGEQELTILVDGTPARSQTVSVEAGAEETATLAIPDLAPGTYQLAVADWDELVADVWILTTPQFTAPEAVVNGEDVVVGVGLANEGPAAVEHDLTILVDGTPDRTETVSLEAGTEETVTFALDWLAPGTYELAVALADWEGQGRAVWVMTPPAFEIDSVAISPDPLDINDSQEATVTASITNVGEADGSYLLRLELDGDTIEERSIDLQGEASTEATFPISVAEPGTHEVTAGDVTISFEAYQLERPANGTVLTNEIGGGPNELRITNNYDEDHVVLLARPGEGNPALLSVYVRGGSSHTVYGIRDGTYTAYYAYGTAWCTHNQAFTQSANYGRYEDDMSFSSSATMYSEVALEFGVTDGPESPTAWVSEDDLPPM